MLAVRCYKYPEARSTEDKTIYVNCKTVLRCIFCKRCTFATSGGSIWLTPEAGITKWQQSLSQMGLCSSCVPVCLTWWSILFSGSALSRLTPTLSAWAKLISSVGCRFNEMGVLDADQRPNELFSQISTEAQKCSVSPENHRKYFYPHCVISLKV